MLKETIFVLINLFIISHGLQCNLPNDDHRLDCFPQGGSDNQSCEARGCCWAPPNHNTNKGESTSAPYCYYPSDFPTYQMKSLIKTNRGYKGVLSKQQSSYLPKEILNLDFEVIYETNSRVRIKITDPNSERFEVPIKLGESDPTPPSNPEYQILVSSNGSFSFEVKRKLDGLSLYKSFGPLLYSDQFIQISTFMATDQVYGIGEQSRPFLHNLANQWTRIGLWARDQPTQINHNLYGTHPFYMGMPNNGYAYGVYYFNSNAQEFVLQPTPAITYRTTGGILDIFVFTGGNPEKTVSQYVELIGKPMLPPFWSLGFHLSRYGYKNISHISQVLKRNIDAGVPVEVQWSDIDYMDGYKVFTYDPIRFSDMGGFVKQLRENYGIRYVIILDPGIRIENPRAYKPYDEGLEMNIFVRDSTTNKPLVGKVWPGNTVFPDFTHPNITKYWLRQIQRFYNSVPIDGLWIDMNEPASFLDGSISGCPKDSSYDYPFFTPAILDNSLLKKTICSSSLHYNDVRHYNLHNLYGLMEAVITNQALLNIIPKKRAFILSRSTFSGSGKYTFHWTGDNNSSWDQLAHSIREVLNFNMFGIPMTGADICGFISNTTEELCIRWMQVGIFYPFMRNHNNIYEMDQDPASWSEPTQEIMKFAMMIRYSFLPNFYTLLVKSHLYGGTVMRPLSFEFYSDYVTHSIDSQFMIGPYLLVSPVLRQGATNVLAYFPAGVWYDLFSPEVIYSGYRGQWLNLDAPINKINIALRGGHIITMSIPGMTTELTRKNNITLFCGLSQNYTADGDLYWDDGESLNSYTEKAYTYIVFTATVNSLVITPVHIGFVPIPSLRNIVILGLSQKSINSVRLNGISVPFFFRPGSLEAMTENADMTKSIDIQWQ